LENIRIMQLTKQHRESLLSELQKAKEDKEFQQWSLNKREDDHLTGWYEIHIFLAEQRIKLIEKSLIDNEIDF